MPIKITPYHTSNVPGTCISSFMRFEETERSTYHRNDDPLNELLEYTASATIISVPTDGLIDTFLKSEPWNKCVSLLPSFGGENRTYYYVYATNLRNVKNVENKKFIRRNVEILMEGRWVPKAGDVCVNFGAHYLRNDFGSKRMDENTFRERLEVSIKAAEEYACSLPKENLFRDFPGNNHIIRQVTPEIKRGYGIRDERTLTWSYVDPSKNIGYIVPINEDIIIKE